jgi:hypothetical protein
MIGKFMDVHSKFMDVHSIILSIYERFIYQAIALC